MIFFLFSCTKFNLTFQWFCLKFSNDFILCFTLKFCVHFTIITRILVERNSLINCSLFAALSELLALNDSNAPGWSSYIVKHTLLSAVANECEEKREKQKTEAEKGRTTNARRCQAYRKMKKSWTNVDETSLQNANAMLLFWFYFCSGSFGTYARFAISNEVALSGG